MGSRKYYRIRLGQGAKHAQECFDNKFIGADWGFKESLEGNLVDNRHDI